MSLFGTIMSKIFGTTPAQAETAQPGAAPSAASTAASAAGAAAAAAGSVDVAQILDGMNASQPQKLNWRQSIVDLMKLVGMDSSLAARKELAKELGYTGDTSDSASMNIWLHKQVMAKIAANGGKLPDDLKD